MRRFGRGSSAESPNDHLAVSYTFRSCAGLSAAVSRTGQARLFCNKLQNTLSRENRRGQRQKSVGGGMESMFNRRKRRKQRKTGSRLSVSSVCSCSNSWPLVVHLGGKLCGHGAMQSIFQHLGGVSHSFIRTARVGAPCKPFSKKAKSSSAWIPQLFGESKRKRPA